MTVVKEKIISEEEILRIVAERENEPSVSFEEVYYDVLNYNPAV